MTDKSIAIVGAGPAGLMAAWKTAQQGHRVTVYEAADQVGGMAASLDIGGQRVDYGSHRLHPATDTDIMADLQALLGDDLQVRIRNGRIRLRDRWVAFPLRTNDLLTSLPPSFGLRAGFEAATAPLRKRRADTFGSTIQSGLGKTVSREFYEPYALKLWGTPAHQLDADLARRRVSASSIRDIATRLLRTRNAEGRKFLYPRHGYGQICERLAEAATGAGADIKLSTPITGITIGNSNIKVESGPIRPESFDPESFDPESFDPESFDPESFDMVWSTGPLTLLARSLRPAPPDDLLENATRLRHRGLVLVYLICAQNQYTPFDAHYFPGLDTPIARLSEPKNYRDGPDPIDQTVLCAEVPCDVDDATWASNDEDLAALVAQSLEAQGLPRPDYIDVETRRIPHVYPIYPVGYKESLDELLAFIEQYDRLVNFGRQGLFVPDNLHHTLAMGAAAAAALDADGNFDHDTWKRSLRKFQAHVVED